ncbi:MAG: hypothetical protein RL560_11 [Actinomycetota bacterium]|jgi:hypothetical protein
MKKESGGLMGKAMEMLFPLLVAGVGWLLTQIASFNNRLIGVESKMPMLLTAEGVVISSPQDAAARQAMKEDLLDKIFDLQVRVKLLEQEVEQEAKTK